MTKRTAKEEMEKKYLVTFAYYYYSAHAVHIPSYN